jgi:hypothetical protein
VNLPDGMNMLARPVMNGLCRYESLVDGTLDLNDVLEMNEWLDVKEENDARLEEVQKRNQ